MKRLAILGSTGSIGRQTLEVVAHLNELGLEFEFEVVALAAGTNIELLLEQARRFKPRFICVAEPARAEELRERLAPELDEDGVEVRVLAGEEGLLRLAALPEVDLVVNALVGAVGLEPTLAALEAGKALALANKESLVIGGHLVRRALEGGRGKLIPIDSEHSALFQLLEGRDPTEVERVILTASGGALRERPLAELERVTPEEVLRHPNWRMGKRITVDSATLVNKGFEVIEAHWLFGLEYDRIEALLHPQSIIHGLVELRDGTVLAALSPPDMRGPIQYALTYPERAPVASCSSNSSNSFPRLSLVGLELELAEIDPERYPAFELVVEAGRLGGTMPAAINAADEVLVERFLRGEIPFPRIWEGLQEVFAAHRPRWRAEPTLEGIKAADRWAREFAQGLFI